MSRGIIGVTVGTPISPKAIERKIKPVKTVNGVVPDENGNVNIDGNEVYVLVDGETLADAPETAEIIIDPNEEAPSYVQTVNGIAPDQNGNVNVQGNAGADGVGIKSISITEV